MEKEKMKIKIEVGKGFCLGFLPYGARLKNIFNKNSFKALANIHNKEGVEKWMKK